MTVESQYYEWIWKKGGRCYLCGRMYPKWAPDSGEKIGLVRFRKSNHLTQPILICRICLRRFAHLAAELKVFDINEEFLGDEEVD